MKPLKTEAIEIQVVEQGGPVVNHGVCLGERKSGIVALEIDMRSKRCSVEMMGTAIHPRLYIAASPDSLHLDGSQPAENWTTIAITSFGGEWRVLTAQIHRYTLYAVLMNNRMYMAQAEGELDDNHTPST